MSHLRKVQHGSGFSWQATVIAGGGKRRSKNFPTKAAAAAWARENDGAGAAGSTTMTLAELARDHNRWFAGLVRAGDRGQRTLDGYESHLDVHLLADEAVARTKLCDLTSPVIQGFLDRLIARGGSSETARRVKKSISAWCAHGARNGWLRMNPADACKVVEKRRRRASAITIPPKPQISALIGCAVENERDAAMASLLTFAGLRISELLGAADDAVELKRQGGGVIHVRERLCSKHVTLGEVKSEEGYRLVPLGPQTATAIRAWRLKRGPSNPFRAGGLLVPGRLFPAPPGLRHGPLWGYQDWRRLVWWPLMLSAGLGSREPDAKGVMRPRVDFGPHTLRHVYASIQIENGVKPKRLQALMGHATLAITMDLYGHLWTDDAADESLAAATERAIPRTAG